jgi:hypothetical protein
MPAVNWWAILLCGVASMVLGFVWYGAVFRDLWVRLSKHDMSHLSDAQKKSAANKGYIIAFIGSLVMAYVLSFVLVEGQAYFKVSAMTAGLQAGFWSWLGFIAPVTLGGVLWEGKSWKLWFLNNAYNLLQLLIFGAILGAWPAK